MADSVEVLLAEYSELKREQGNRIDRRDHLVYATLTAAAGVVAAAARFGPSGLPLLPPVCLVLGWTYVRNDRRVSEIGDYLRDDLAQRLGQVAGGPALGWESSHGQARGRWLRKSVQLVCDLVAFAVPAVVTLVAFRLNTSGHMSAPLRLVVAIEAAATVAFAAAVVWLAEIRTAVNR